MLTYQESAYFLVTAPYKSVPILSLFVSFGVEGCLVNIFFLLSCWIDHLSEQLI